MEKLSSSGPISIVSELSRRLTVAPWKGQDRLQNENELQQENIALFPASVLPEIRRAFGEGVPWPGCDPEGHWTVTSSEICE